jgi:hypothetical protein
MLEPHTLNNKKQIIMESFSTELASLRDADGIGMAWVTELASLRDADRIGMTWVTELEFFLDVNNLG